MGFKVAHLSEIMGLSSTNQVVDVASSDEKTGSQGRLSVDGILGSEIAKVAGYLFNPSPPDKTLETLICRTLQE